MNLVAAASVGGALFLLALGIVLWMEIGDAVFRAMMEVGFLLCQ